MYYDKCEFDDSFPLGLPVGIKKPNLTVSYQRGTQRIAWQENACLAVLKGDIYPNFCLHDFNSWFATENKLESFVSPSVTFTSSQAKQKYLVRSWTIAVNLCQTETEKIFLKEYIRKYACAYEQYSWKHKSTKNTSGWNLSLDLKDKVPALIPQVWIKWDNQSGKYLNRMGYETESPYRIDFAIFWKNKFYIVLLDGIQHYARQQGTRWDADEQAYAARLREDRLLRLQGWEVFRIGNWEIKDDIRREQVLEELREFIDFPKPPVNTESNELDFDDIPF